MSIKKIVKIVSVALVAVAFAVPASASALEWTHEGEPLAETAEISYTGHVMYFSSAGGVTCETAHGKGTISPGTTGTVTSFDGTGCKGTGLLAGCTIVHDIADVTPAWTIHITGADTFAIRGIIIHNLFTGGFCPLNGEVSTLTGEVSATVDNPSEISSVTLTGQMNSSGLGAVGVIGTLTVTPAKTFGIG